MLYLKCAPFCHLIPFTPSPIPLQHPFIKWLPPLHSKSFMQLFIHSIRPSSYALFFLTSPSCFPIIWSHSGKQCLSYEAGKTRNAVQIHPFNTSFLASSSIYLYNFLMSCIFYSALERDHSLPINQLVLRVLHESLPMLYTIFFSWEYLFITKSLHNRG